MVCWFHIRDDIFTCTDAASFERFKGKLWFLAKGGYAGTRGEKGEAPFLLHRLVIGAERGQMVDHINGDKLDNRLENLRIVTHAQNMHNSTKSGVHFHTRDQKWSAQCSGKWLGYYPDQAAAENAYREAALTRSDHSFYNRPITQSPRPSHLEQLAAIDARRELEAAQEKARIDLSRAARRRPVINDKGEVFPSTGVAAEAYKMVPRTMAQWCQMEKNGWRFADASRHT